MKALLLAAGLGTRLKPVTDNIPKCLVPINGRPLLGYWLELLDHAGVNEFHINLHYFADRVREFIASTPYQSHVHFIEEEELLGTGGTLKKNAERFQDGSFLLAHADNLCLTDFKTFIKAHYNRPRRAALTMMTFDPPDPRSCGVVELDGDNIVTGFYEKVENPPTKLANGAVFVMEPEVAQFAQNMNKIHFEISRDIIPAFTGRCLAWHNAEYHLDIGTPETYQKAKEDRAIVETLYRKYTE